MLHRDLHRIFMCAALERTKRNLSLPPYRRTVAQLRGSLRVWAVGPLTQRFGQLSLFHGSANTLLSGCVASVQPGEWKEKKRQKEKKTTEMKTKQKWEQKRHCNVKNSYSKTPLHDSLEGPRQNVYYTMQIVWLVKDRCLSATLWHTQQMFYEHFMNKATLVRKGMYKRKKCVWVSFFWSWGGFYASLLCLLHQKSANHFVLSTCMITAFNAEKSLVFQALPLVFPKHILHKAKQVAPHGFPVCSQSESFLMFGKWLQQVANADYTSL